MSDPRINDTLQRIVDLCYEMLELADHGDSFRQDIECGIIFGTVRDTAYKIRQLAENELKRHNQKHPSKKLSPKKTVI